MPPDRAAWAERRLREIEAARSRHALAEARQQLLSKFLDEVAKLVAGGYTRSVVVEEPGDFCVRGGIIDIFSPLYDDPLRIELFGIGLAPP